MTTIQFATIANSIAGIDLSEKGIRSYRPDEMPANGLTNCPYFALRPRQSISNLQLTREAFGAGGNEPMNLVYDMTWQYFHAPIGGVLTFQKYTGLLENLAYILEQLADNDAPEGSVDMKVENISDIAGIEDPAGNLFHGVELVLRITEFIK